MRSCEIRGGRNSNCESLSIHAVTDSHSEDMDALLERPPGDAVGCDWSDGDATECDGDRSPSCGGLRMRLVLARRRLEPRPHHWPRLGSDPGDQRWILRTCLRVLCIVHTPTGPISWATQSSGQVGDTLAPRYRIEWSHRRRQDSPGPLSVISMMSSTATLQSQNRSWRGGFSNFERPTGYRARQSRGARPVVCSRLVVTSRNTPHRFLCSGCSGSGSRVSHASSWGVRKFGFPWIAGAGFWKRLSFMGRSGFRCWRWQGAGSLKCPALLS